MEFKDLLEIILGKQKRISGYVANISESSVKGESYVIYDVKMHNGQHVFVHSNDEFQRLNLGKRVRMYVNISEKLKVKIGNKEVESSKLERYKAKSC